MARANIIPLGSVAMPPSWAAFAREVSESLLTLPGEPTTASRRAVRVWLPDPLWADYTEYAQRLGWTLDEFLSFLTLRGALTLAQEAAVAAEEHAHPPA